MMTVMTEITENSAPASLFDTPCSSGGARAVLNSPLTREQVVDRIMTINPTAAPDFLARFKSQPLRNYLDHLLSAQQPRGRHSGWLRPGDSPAIMVAERAD